MSDFQPGDRVRMTNPEDYWRGVIGTVLYVYIDKDNQLILEISAEEEARYSDGAPVGSRYRIDGPGYSYEGRSYDHGWFSWTATDWEIIEPRENSSEALNELERLLGYAPYLKRIERLEAALKDEGYTLEEVYQIEVGKL